MAPGVQASAREYKIVNNLVWYLRGVSEPGAYATLHAAIVAGELSPGERLIEEELAERLGLSRGAVREAILRLGPEGLVVRERKPGARGGRLTLGGGGENLQARAPAAAPPARHPAPRRRRGEGPEA